LAHPHRIDRLGNRMNIARLPDLTHRPGSVMPRRTVLKRQQVRRRRASTGITASIAKLTESAGTFEATGGTNLEAGEGSRPFFARTLANPLDAHWQQPR
jgi:hypothetical protein